MTVFKFVVVMKGTIIILLLYEYELIKKGILTLYLNNVSNEPWIKKRTVSCDFVWSARVLVWIVPSESLFWFLLFNYLVHFFFFYATSFFSLCWGSANFADTKSAQ